MNDELKKPTSDSLWQDLVRAEAAATPSPESRVASPDWRSWAWIELADQHGNQRLFYSEKHYEQGVHKSYLTGCQHERLYWHEQLAKNRERKWLALGAAAFFGFCGGMLAAALLTWRLR